MKSTGGKSKGKGKNVRGMKGNGQGKTVRLHTKEKRKV